MIPNPKISQYGHKKDKINDRGRGKEGDRCEMVEKRELECTR